MNIKNNITINLHFILILIGILINTKELYSQDFTYILLNIENKIEIFNFK